MQSSQTQPLYGCSGVNTIKLFCFATDAAEK